MDFHFILLFVILWYSFYATYDSNLRSIMSQSVVQFGMDPLLMNSQIRLNIIFF